MSEVHALGLSMCCGGGTQIKDSESGREEGTLDTLIRRERRLFGMERIEGGKEGYMTLSWCLSKHFCLLGILVLAN